MGEPYGETCNLTSEVGEAIMAWRLSSCEHNNYNPTRGCGSLCCLRLPPKITGCCKDAMVGGWASVFGLWVLRS